MNDHEKVVEYELQIEDMLRTIQERLDEFRQADGVLSEFEDGRQTAYCEIADIIKARHKMILEVIAED